MLNIDRMDKKCKSCEIIKPNSDFHSHKKSKDRLAYICKVCFNKTQIVYRLKYPEKIKQVNRDAYLRKREDRINDAIKWKAKNPEKSKAIKLKFKNNNPDYSRFLTLKRHGLTTNQFDKMISSCNNSCEICKKIFKSKPDAKIDHCHTTGKVRGILCGHCNTALGLVNDNDKILLSMIDYLKNTK